MMKQEIINELSKLNIKSEEYLEKYVDFCLLNSNKDLYDCKHHILPKSKNLPFVEYSNLNTNIWNCSYMTYQNHFIAHWLLVMAVKHQSISFAFNSMKNKDVKNKRIDEYTINMFSDSYSKILSECNEFNSNKNRDRVVCIDSQGKTITVKKDVYRCNKDIYSTHSSGVLNVTDTNSGKRIRINKQNYDSQKHIFHTNGVCCYFNLNTRVFEMLDTIKRSESHLPLNKIIFIKRNNMIGEIRVRDLKQTDEIIEINAKEYREQLYTKVQKQTKQKSMLFYDLIDKKELYMTCNIDNMRYVNLTYANTSRLRVIDRETYEVYNLVHYTEFNIQKHIYFNHTQRYYIDIVEKQIISSSEKLNENYVSFSKSNIKKYLNKDFIKYNKSDKFISPNLNKVLAYNLHSSEVSSVSRDLFLNSDHLVGFQNKLAAKHRGLDDISRSI